MSTPESIRADAREQERYEREGPSPDQPCDAEFCATDCIEDDGRFVHEINMGSGDTGDYDVMAYCSCDHHEKGATDD